MLILSTMSSTYESREPKDSRLGVRLTAEQVSALEDIANLRFGGNRSTTVLTGIDLVTLVYGDVSTFYARSPIDALTAYVESQRNS